uniref:Uncharacterized protein n=1 Tax=Strombidium rassoulzadegani TaxID=1082188 RepID=A0A7S3CT28_9SPIT|mmetsp:Transcript_4331/g.7311  ORF Transcript_4331/g.7311 Transcript_4331/m.7311 type:complete len:521 (+) Transcript_4331:520-2082(+)
MKRIEERGANIIVTSPGRIYDLIQKKAIDLRSLEVFVMDEADKLLDQGVNLIKIQAIIDSLPRQRRTGLFSATMPSQLKEMIKTGMRNPYVVDVKTVNQSIFSTDKDDALSIQVQSFDNFAQSKEEINFQIKNITEIPQNLENFHLVLRDQSHKLPAFQHFLNKEIKSSRIIVFFSTCSSVNFHFPILQRLFESDSQGESAQGGMPCKFYKLHGKIQQKQRYKIFRQFKEEQLHGNHLVLLTTDLASRGIDIPDVDWIIQFDPPQHSESFIHRIGRTARAGKEGQSVIFLTKAEFSYVSYLQGKHVDINDYQFKEMEGDEEDGLEKLWVSQRDLIHKEMLQDKDIVDKAQDAFVSFIRYYKEHQLSFIFSFTLLEIGRVANSFFLFRIPRVKEILGKQISGFEMKRDIVIEKIPYADKNKFHQKEEVTLKRKEKFQQKVEEREEKERIQADEKLQLKLEKQKKYEKTKTHKKFKKREADWSEWQDLQREENLAKKLKKGKISKEEFDKLLQNDSDDLASD